MKLRSKILIITIMAVVALMGVGYATWTFTTAKTENVNVAGTAFAAIEANNVQIKNAEGTADVTNLYIICAKPEADGIYWSTTADGNNRITQIKLIGSVNEDDLGKLDFTTYTGTFSCAYVGNSTLTYVNIPAFALTEDVVSTGKNTDVEYVYTLPTLSYKTTPANVAQVQAMYAEVSALSSIEIQFSFNVKAVA
jgi:hypothetical protein